jgi:hypothetical protein
MQSQFSACPSLTDTICLCSEREHPQRDQTKLLQLRQWEKAWMRLVSWCGAQSSYPKEFDAPFVCCVATPNVDMSWCHEFGLCRLVSTTRISPSQVLELAKEYHFPRMLIFQMSGETGLTLRFKNVSALQRLCDDVVGIKDRWDVLQLGGQRTAWSHSASCAPDTWDPKEQWLPRLWKELILPTTMQSSTAALWSRTGMTSVGVPLVGDGPKQAAMRNTQIQSYQCYPQRVLDKHASKWHYHVNKARDVLLLFILPMISIVFWLFVFIWIGKKAFTGCNTLASTITTSRAWNWATRPLYAHFQNYHKQLEDENTSYQQKL